MKRFRFRIGSVLVLVLLLGVGFAALREANELWDGIVLTAALGVLLVSVSLALHRRAEKRAFWVGFALFGWGYVALTLLPAIEPRLLTSRALTYLDSKVPGRTVTIVGQLPSDTASSPGLPVTFAFTPANTVVADPTLRLVRLYEASVNKKILGSAGGTTENFLRIGHSLCALILAWLGGDLSRRLHVRNRDVLPGPVVP